MPLHSVLQDLGLSENETSIYLANLELGAATIQEIARKSKVKRTTIYTAMETLKEKGLASESKQGLKTFLVASDPENLIHLYGKRLKRLKQVLPELKSVYNTSDVKPKIKFYEGREGYVSVYEGVIKDSPKELLVIMSYDDFYRHLDPQYEKEWIRRRAEKDIKLRWLVFKTIRTMSMKAEDKKLLRQTRFLPPGFSFTSGLFIYSDKIITISGKQREFTAVVMENTEFYQMFRQFFEMIWQRAQ